MLLLKAPPSLQGVVIDKKLFTRSVKDKRKRNQDKQELEALEMFMTKSLMP